MAWHWQQQPFAGNHELQHLALQRYPLEGALSLWEEPSLPEQSLTRSCTDIRLRLCDVIQYSNCGKGMLQFCLWAGMTPPNDPLLLSFDP